MPPYYVYKDCVIDSVYMLLLCVLVVHNKGNVHYVCTDSRESNKWSCININVLVTVHTAYNTV